MSASRAPLLLALAILVGAVPAATGAGVATADAHPPTAPTAVHAEAGGAGSLEAPPPGAEPPSRERAQGPALELAGTLSPAPPGEVPAGDPVLPAIEAQAAAMDVEGAEPYPLPASERPSEAVQGLAGLVDAPLSDGDRERLEALDRLDPGTRDVLTRFVDAFAALSTASRDALREADRARLASMLDQVRRGEAPGADAGPAGDEPVPGPATSAASPHGERVPALGFLEEAGLELDRLHATRTQFLEATRDLADALETRSGAPAGEGGRVDACPVAAFDLAGRNSTYERDCMLVLDVGGHDRYHNNAGGSGVTAPGLPGFPDDPCALQPDPADPQPPFPRTAALADLGRGDDAYGNPEDPRACGANGGAFVGTGFLLDAGGDDSYTTDLDASNGGVNGGGFPGLGFLLDAGGDDTYVAGAGGANGGGGLGAGLLVDRRGDDTYRSGTINSNGGATAGFGMLVDGAGDDTYRARGTGTNGGAALGGLGSLLDLDGGDRYLVETTSGTTANANGAGSDDAVLPAFGLLWDANGSDAYRDHQVPGGDCGDCTVAPKGLAGLQVDADQLPRERVREACGDRPRHPPIRVTENRGPAGFALAVQAPGAEPFARPGSGVVAGSGTEDNPYVIRGWCIESPRGGAAIEVAGTDAHVAIRDTVLVGGGTPLDNRGAWIHDAANVTLADNLATETEVGLLLENVEDVAVRENRVASTFQDGVVVDASEAVALRNNTVEDNVRAGIVVEDSPRTEVRGTAARGNLDAYRILGSDDVSIREATTSSQRHGLLATGGQGLLVRDSRLAGEAAGAVLQGADEPRIEDSRLAGSTAGARVEFTDGAVLADNAAAGTAGVRLSFSTDARIEDNDLGRGLVLRTSSPGEAVHAVANNTVRGEPLRYVAGGNGTEVPAPAGQVIVADSGNVSVSGLDFDGVAEPVQLEASDNVTVANVTADDSRLHGIRALRTVDATVENATVRSSGRSGIDLFGVRDVTVRDSTVTGNAELGIDVLDGPGTRIVNATASRNGDTGLEIILSDGSQARRNTLEDNADSGLVVASTTGALAANNTARRNADSGVEVARAAEVDARDNVVEDNGNFGLRLFQVESSVAEHNAARGNPVGVLVDELFNPAAVDSRVRANEAIANEVGIRAEGRLENTTFRANNVRDSLEGVGLNASEAEATVDARDNWWGCSGGPENSACDDVRGDAAFDPWLEEANPDAGPR